MSISNSFCLPLKSSLFMFSTARKKKKKENIFTVIRKFRLKVVKVFWKDTQIDYLQKNNVNVSISVKTPMIGPISIDPTSKSTSEPPPPPRSHRYSCLTILPSFPVLQLTWSIPMALDKVDKKITLGAFKIRDDPVLHRNFNKIHLSHIAMFKMVTTLIKIHWLQL